MAGFPKPKKYRVKNPSKYMGDPTKVILRSSWEAKLARQCDELDYIVKWGVESIAIPYLSPVDNRMHRYFPDFIIYSKKGSKIIKTMIEVKPYAQTIPPKTANRRKKTVINETITYSVNMAKWEAARKYCKNHDMIFKIFTERELKI